MSADYDSFRTAILDLIALHRRRLEALPLPDADLQAELEDLETENLTLVDTTTVVDNRDGEWPRADGGGSSGVVATFSIYRACCHQPSRLEAQKCHLAAEAA